MTILKHTSIDPLERAALESVIAQQRTLEEVIRWGLGEDPRALIVDVVVQDEYTHDVVLSYRDGIYIVYDTT
jgi:hypothetical protein